MVLMGMSMGNRGRTGLGGRTGIRHGGRIEEGEKINNWQEERRTKREMLLEVRKS